MGCCLHLTWYFEIGMPLLCHNKSQFYAQVLKKFIIPLEAKRLRKLAYVSYNIRLHDQNQHTKQDQNDNYDPIFSVDLNFCNEWMTGIAEPSNEFLKTDLHGLMQIIQWRGNRTCRSIDWKWSTSFKEKTSTTIAHQQRWRNTTYWIRKNHLWWKWSKTKIELEELKLKFWKHILCWTWFILILIITCFTFWEEHELKSRTHGWCALTFENMVIYIGVTNILIQEEKIKIIPLQIQLLTNSNIENIKEIFS